MDFKKIQEKIPFLKDVDFSDPKTRKSYAAMAIAIVAIIAYATYTAVSLFSDDEENSVEKVETRRTGSNSVVPEFPDGENNEEQYKSHIEALADARRGQNRARDIWAQASDYGSLKSKFDSVSAAKTGSDAAAKNTDERFLGRTNVYGNAGTKKQSVSEEEDVQARIQKRKRELLLANGIDPDTNMPLAYSTYSKDPEVAAAQYEAGGPEAYKRQQQQQQQTQEPAKEEAPVVAPPKVVRRTSNISTLDDSNSNSLGEITSLDDSDEYISENDIHPIKVMFSKTMKVSNNQRVYLRLLEDIMADGILIPKNTQIPATCQIGERIQIKVTSLELNNKIYTLNFDGYDTDGGQGLYCPETTANKNVKEGVKQGASIFSSMISSIVSGYAGQVTNAATTMAQSNLNRTEVTISAGYTFFLVRNQR